MIDLTRRYRFHAAHRNPALVGTKCVKIHGHSYQVEFGFRFEKQDPTTGVTIPFDAIDAVIEPIIDELDHAFLVDPTDPLVGLIPDEFVKWYKVEGGSSAENVAEHLFKRVAGSGIGAGLARVQVQETGSSVVGYWE